MNTETWVCSKCGYEYKEPEAAHEHQYNFEVMSMDLGYHWYECTDPDCPDKLGSAAEYRGKHQLEAWRVMKAATTAETGLKVRSCQLDGCEYSETGEIPVKPPTPGGGWYYGGTEEVVPAPKTADGGALVYLGLALSAYTGTALTVRREKKRG